MCSSQETALCGLPFRKCCDLGHIERTHRPEVGQNEDMNTQTPMHQSPSHIEVHASVAGTNSLNQSSLAPVSADEQAIVLQNVYAHPLVQEALGILHSSLPPDLYYHNVQHTLSVIKATVLCAACDKPPQRDIELLAIAAAWHDVGYVEQRRANEPIGARMAAAAMRRHGSYSDTEIADVVTAILDTEVVSDPATASLIQKASGRLSPWLLDGDLSNFASEVFLPTSLKLFQEFTGAVVSSVKDLEDPAAIQFIASTLRMLNRHEYKSEGARLLLTPQKELSIRRLGNLLAQLIGGTEESRQNAWNAMMLVD